MMLAAVETVTNADPVWESRCHNPTSPHRQPPVNRSMLRLLQINRSEWMQRSLPGHDTSEEAEMHTQRKEPRHSLHPSGSRLEDTVRPRPLEQRPPGYRLGARTGTDASTATPLNRNHTAAWPPPQPNQEGRLRDDRHAYVLSLDRPLAGGPGSSRSRRPSRSRSASAVGVPASRAAVGSVYFDANNNAAAGETLFNGTFTGPGNVGLGRSVMPNLTTGANNTGVGDHALFSNTSGGDNVATGDGALSLNTTGDNNVATGINALLEHDRRQQRRHRHLCAALQHDRGASTSRPAPTPCERTRPASPTSPPASGALHKNTTGQRQHRARLSSRSEPDHRLEQHRHRQRRRRRRVGDDPDRRDPRPHRHLHRRGSR